MNRRALLGFVTAGAAIGVRASIAVAAEKVHRLGIFVGGDRDAMLKIEHEGNGFLKLLADIGYVDGRNLAVDWRILDMTMTPRLPELAADLVRQRPDVIFSHGTPWTKALQGATKTIPIVTSVGNPVASGFARSLAQPGGNITGLAHQHPDIAEKQVELLRQLVPKLAKVAYVDDIRYGGARELARPYEDAIKANGLAAEVRLIGRADFERTFVEMSRSGNTAALLEFGDETLVPELARLALRHRVPAMSINESGPIEAGLLAKLFMYHSNAGARMAGVIDKVFRGQNPAQIPWELPDRTQLAINLITAKALGLVIPHDVIVRADQVIK